jgi:predicted metal-dependent hydrolase
MSAPIIKIDKIIRSKRKSIALVVTADAKLVVRAPFRTSSGYIESLVRQKIQWITEKQLAVIRSNEMHQDRRFVDGEEFLFLGEAYGLELEDGKFQVELKPGKLILHISEQDCAAICLKNWYRKRAKHILSGRVEYLSNMTGIRYKSVKITDARKRWGSCGPKDTLNFTWRLVMAPLCVADYVVIHELVHVEFRNHSKHFWTRVEALMPEYKKCRKWLKDNQKLLDLM